MKSHCKKVGTDRRLLSPDLSGAIGNYVGDDVRRHVLLPRRHPKNPLPPSRLRERRQINIIFRTILSQNEPNAPKRMTSAIVNCVPRAGKPAGLIPALHPNTPIAQKLSRRSPLDEHVHMS